MSCGRGQQLRRGEEETLAAGTEDCVATRVSPRIIPIVAPSDYAMRATILQKRCLIWVVSGKHPKSSHVSSEVSYPVLPRLQLNPGLASLTLTLLHTITWTECCQYV